MTQLLKFLLWRNNHLKKNGPKEFLTIRDVLEIFPCTFTSYDNTSSFCARIWMLCVAFVHFLSLLLQGCRKWVGGGTGVARPPTPDFSRSVNPISTRGSKLYPLDYYSPPPPDFQNFRHTWFYTRRRRSILTFHWNLWPIFDVYHPKNHWSSLSTGSFLQNQTISDTEWHFDYRLALSF